jgi:hypothetical protein
LLIEVLPLLLKFSKTGTEFARRGVGDNQAGRPEAPDVSDEVLSMRRLDLAAPGGHQHPFAIQDADGQLRMPPVA